MLTGELRNQIDRIWDAFWSGGIANPLEVIEQITYLLFLRRLDDLHTLEELKATRLKRPMERRVFPRARTTSAAPTRTSAGHGASINREMALLARAFSLALKNEKIKAVPKFPRYSELANVRKGFAEPEEIRHILAYGPKQPWFPALVEVARTFAWRRGELVGVMKVNQLDFLRRTVRLDTSKNGEGREVTMSNEVYRRLLECCRGKSPNDYVFTWPDGAPVKEFRHHWELACTLAGKGRRFCAKCAQPDGAGKKYCKCGGRIKYTGLRFHDLRRGGARALRRAGVSEGVIMEIGGWKSRDVFERYNIKNQDDIKRGIQERERVEEAELAALAKAATESQPTGYSDSYSRPESDATEAVN